MSNCLFVAVLQINTWASCARSSWTWDLNVEVLQMFTLTTAAMFHQSVWCEDCVGLASPRAHQLWVKTLTWTASTRSGQTAARAALTLLLARFCQERRSCWKRHRKLMLPLLFWRHAHLSFIYFILFWQRFAAGGRLSHLHFVVELKHHLIKFLHI